MYCGLYFQILNRHFSLSCNDMVHLFSGMSNQKDMADFPTVRKLGFVCCCLPEFMMNPPQTVSVMLVLRDCACACVSVACRSPPKSVTECAVLGHGAECSH